MTSSVILIADDDATLRDVYVRTFGKTGYTPVTVSDGADAIAFLEREQPALMLCDIHMQRIDGFEVLRRFPRKKRKFPIFMLTNFADEESRNKAESLGADKYLVKKDMTLKGLLQTVKQVLSQAQ